MAYGKDLLYHLVLRTASWALEKRGRQFLRSRCTAQAGARCADLEHAGYGEIIGSWIGEGRNEPIEPQQIAVALGPHASDLSRNSGLPREVLLQELARLLPAVIDRITPHGKRPVPLLPHSL
jgi:uncharacterized protein YidB (DUF937 family)